MSWPRTIELTVVRASCILVSTKSVALRQMKMKSTLLYLQTLSTRIGDNHKIITTNQNALWLEQVQRTTALPEEQTWGDSKPLATYNMITYPKLPSALRPVAHGLGIPVPKALVASKVQECVDSEPKDQFDTSFEVQSDAPKLFSQADLNDLVGDLELSKESAMLLGSRLKERAI
ncbi:hypothetical protein LOD99_7116 [Oopsacas minuta]|uniref:Uncharacterized protein n=1 Tax=Oopsacas minuta TaxID=111878 RepID=A0AAV7JJZ6_9METZ|nr:hypothetical protein LOD99_7116 [Oopsacas minuta]